MFVPIPTENICDLSSRSSRYIATTVCRTWKNPNPATWHIIPEAIDLRPDGTGTVSSSYTTFTDAGLVATSARQEFTWKLGRDGPLGMEDMDIDALYETMPRLMKSTHAWTHKSWTSEHGLVPAYIRIDLVGQNSLETEAPISHDFHTDKSAPGVQLPAEIIEDIVRLAAAEDVAAADLLRVCKWTREMVLGRRRRERFAVLTRRFAAWGLAFWMTCGHFNPSGAPQPKSLFAFRAQVFKMPTASGYHAFDASGNWDSTWDDRPLYYSCELPVPEQADSMFWRITHGRRYYDELPEVPKVFDA